MQVFCPSSTDELDPMLATALASGLPCVIRYPKTPSTPALGPEVEPYAARRLTDGDGECVLIGVGKLASTALGATEMLAEDGFAITCFDPRVIRPADEAMLEEAAAADVVVTVEDGLAAGGAGAYLCHEISARARRSGRPVPAQLVLGMPTAFVPQAKPDSILARAGLDVRGVATAVREVIAHSRSTRRSHHEREASLVSRSVLARSSGEQ
jgi:1-deoxy-D-xylulose-5-phosphate synthase